MTNATPQNAHADTDAQAHTSSARNTAHKDKQAIREQIREYYGKTLASSDDLQTNACQLAHDAPPAYVQDVLRELPDEIFARSFGCGSPIPPALTGCTVVDLGCGSGIDVYVLSKLVGESGHVIGIDMTDEQLQVARAHQSEMATKFGFEKSNVTFVSGYIEDLESLGIEDESIDLVVSNCVINLSPFKDEVFSEIFRVLKWGGELYFSDVFSDRRLPAEIMEDPVIRGECLGGALYIGDFERIMRTHGWASFYYTQNDQIEVGDLAMATKLGFSSFTSRTVRAIKAHNLETTEENYGQIATYTGNMPQMPRYFDFTQSMRFIKGRSLAISKNMACALSESRYGKYFEISAPRAHRGPFVENLAQKALDLKTGKARVNLNFLNEACKRLNIESFDARINNDEILEASTSPSIMQVNVTYACNLACTHCYLECSPKNTQTMSKEVMDACLSAFSYHQFSVMDITGGSPEMHPNFEDFLQQSAKLAKQVIVRSNLTLYEKPAYEHLLKMYADLGVCIYASLPYFDATGANAQRGKGAFERAVSAIKKLNALGYGKQDGLELNIVYNVEGPYLPLPQVLIEEAYHKKLEETEGIAFNNLFAFNNFPLGRFANELCEKGLFDYYLRMLSDNFNVLTAGKIMCKDQLNVDFDGRLYDCECNHVLGLPITHQNGEEAHIQDVTNAPLPSHKIRTHPVCYSCSAGFGSSCHGSLV